MMSTTNNPTTTTSMTTPPPTTDTNTTTDTTDGEHNQYIDYSCSTSIERLSRDVETVLRSWHVCNESDRHVSHCSQHHNHHNIHHHRNTHHYDDGNGNDNENNNNNISSSGRQQPILLLSSQHALRSQVLVWELLIIASAGAPQYNNTAAGGSSSTTSSSTTTHVVELELVLWDAPPPPSPSPLTAAGSSTGGAEPSPQQQQNNNNNANNNNELAYSLQYGEDPTNLIRHLLVTTASSSSQANNNNNNGHDTTNLLFGNFSFLFGIGQHITLTPINTTSLKLPDELIVYLSTDILSRHDNNTKKSNTSATTITPAWSVLRQNLSNWLQTALNLAASNSQCHFPMFGLWGSYQPNATTNTNTNQQRQIRRTTTTTTTAISPCTWIPERTDLIPDNGELRPAKSQPTTRTRGLLFRRHNQQQQDSKANNPYKNLSYYPPVLSGALLGTDCQASFTCSVVPLPSSSSSSSLPSNSRWLYLSSWSSLLQQYGVQRAALWYAQHVYGWFKKPTSSSAAADGNNKTLNTSRDGSFLFSLSGELQDQDDDVDDWRGGISGSAASATIAGSKTSAAAAAATKDLLQPLENSMIDLTTTTQRLQFQQYRKQCQAAAVALLETASGATRDDPLWGPPDDPVAAVEATVSWKGNENTENGSRQLDPLLTLPLKIRSRKLSRDDWVEVQESIERTILDPRLPTSRMSISVHYDHETAQASLAATQRCCLAALIRAATLPQETLCWHICQTSLLQEWDVEAGHVAASELAQQARVSQATAALVAAMDWDDYDLISEERAQDAIRQVLEATSGEDSEFPAVPAALLLPVEDTPTANCTTNKDDLLDSSFKKAAPPARLLSLLGAQMARVRTPSSMALVWLNFCAELRRRWDCRESLPNLGRVPGLDNASGVTHNSKTKMSGGVGGSSTKAHTAENEDQDTLSHCLIGQKLQNFNVCFESALQSEYQREAVFGKRPRLRENEGCTPMMNGQMEHSDNMAEDEFFDAEEMNVDQEGRTKDPLLSPAPSSTSYFGRRCPKPGVSLISTGEQMFVPHLQRSFPLTDDVIAERRQMIAQQQNHANLSASVSRRIEVARRFQEPKLLSDMQAFKAANPGAVFQDFISFYGNPGNPLEDYEDGDTNEVQPQRDQLMASKTPSIDVMESNREAMEARARLDKAGEAIKVLKETREFWTETWEKARPIHASEQPPLFDTSNVVEMALDYFETLHPACLLCQIMAVNFASAFFVLSSSAVAGNVNAANLPIVRQSLTVLRDKVGIALRHLSTDALAASVTANNNNDVNSVNDDTVGSADLTATSTAISTIATVETIASCESACSAFGETEAIVARATSLLNKFDGNYTLVETILRKPEGTPINIRSDDDGMVRKNVIALVSKQKRQSKTATAGDPEPVVREYLFRSVDTPIPCQLCVRYDDESETTSSRQDGNKMMALAITRVSRD